MAASNNRKRDTFTMKVNRLNDNLMALEKIFGTARRLLTQVAGIALIIAIAAGLCVPELLPTVDHLVALLGRTAM